MKNWILRGAAILAILISTLLIAAPAMAIWDWCDVDPIVSIGTHTVSIMTSIPGDPHDINGKIKIYVVVPEGLPSSVISSDHAGKVKLSTGNNTEVEVTAQIKTKVAYDSKLVVLVDGIEAATVTGTTDNALVCTFMIH